MTAADRHSAVDDCASMLAVCRLCGGALGAPLMVHTVCDRFEIAAGIESAGYNRAWRRCEACSVVQNVQMSENEKKLDGLADAYYEVDLGNNVREKFERVMAMPPADSDNAGRVARIREQIGRHPAPSRRRHVLDIGAGLGVFLAKFLEGEGDSWLGTAIEPDPIAAEHLRSLNRFKVIQSIFTGTEKDIPAADLLTLNKVVEHLANPTALLCAAGSFLDAETGMLYVEVPDELTMLRRPDTDNIVGALHKHLYSPRSLAALIGRAGLECIRAERVFEPSGKISVFAFAVAKSAIDRLDMRRR